MGAASVDTSPAVPVKFRGKRGAGQPQRVQEKGAHERPVSQSSPDAATVRFLRQSLLAWYARAKRDLPWRRTRDPYAIWLSEVMLQQTRVETVVPYFERFLARWPTVSSLAEAPIDEVLAAWSGLGYYRRARMLHSGARAIADASAFPSNAEGLARVPGIGRYTAGAVASIAYGEAAPLVDGNVARVFARIFAMEEDLRSTRAVKRLWALATTLVDPRDPGSWNQALMELGAELRVVPGAGSMSRSLARSRGDASKNEDQGAATIAASLGPVARHARRPRAPRPASHRGALRGPLGAAHARCRLRAGDSRPGRGPSRGARRH
jgi:A/G-specific adenine glycosylase